MTPVKFWERSVDNAPTWPANTSGLRPSWDPQTALDPEEHEPRCRPADPIRIPLRDVAGNVKAYAFIDQQDAALGDYRWHMTTMGYVCRHTPGTRANRGPKVWMHREILQAPDDMQVDHINGNRLDNRRSNLRLATQAQNKQNVKPLGGSSRFRGVTFDKQTGRWRAYCKLEGKVYHLGRFDTEEDAARAAALKRAELFTHVNEDREAS